MPLLNSKSSYYSKWEVLFITRIIALMYRLDTVSHLARWNAVQREIHQTGSYDLTLTELSFGIKLAWRNAPRCIGRIQWNKIQV